MKRRYKNTNNKQRYTDIDNNDSNEKILNIDAECEDILQLAQTYNFKKVKMINEYNKVLYIRSNSDDEWYLEPRININNIVLLHQDLGDSHKHFQRQEWNWNYLMNSIKDHDRHEYGIA